MTSDFSPSPELSLWLTPIPEHPAIAPLSCEARNREIEQTNHPTAKAQKYYVWHLLEEAIEKTYGISPRRLSFEKQPSGRWMITGKYSSIHFSLSHCEGAVAVALSCQPVGVDIEPAERLLKPALAQKVLTPDEQTTYDALPVPEQNDYLLRAWVSKEAIYKRMGQGSFCPREIELWQEGAGLDVRTVPVGDRSFCVALVGEDASLNIRVNVIHLKE